MRKTGLDFAGCSACWAVRQRWDLSRRGSDCRPAKKGARGDNRQAFRRATVSCALGSAAAGVESGPRPTSHSERRPCRLSKVQPKQLGTSVSRQWQPKLTVSGCRADAGSLCSLSAFVIGRYAWTRRNNNSRTGFQMFGKAWPHISDTTYIQSNPRSATS